MYRDLTQGGIGRTLVLFSLPMIAGNLLQQLYNIADTLIVGRFLGANALAAVGSAYTLMTFLTSILLGLSMGAGALFAIYQGQGDREKLRGGMVQAFCLIALLTAALTWASYLCIDGIMAFLRVPQAVYPLMQDYLLIIFSGLAATALYNFFASLLRALGNSAAPLAFLAVSALLNIGLDLAFVVGLGWGVAGAAGATVLAQYVSGLGLALYVGLTQRQLLPARRHWTWNRPVLADMGRLSLLTCAQQSVMNLGILMVQGLVNSFGPTVMAAFAAAVKIDSFAYMPVQDFGNGFSTFVAQNYGAGKTDRIRRGIRQAALLTFGFCAVVSTVVIAFARPLLMIFVQPQETEILDAGVGYLWVVALFYWGIGLLFLLYGLYRAVKRPGMSVVLTVISLGTRVALAYLLAGQVGVTGIWAAIPIGWVLADTAGVAYFLKNRKRLLPS